MWTKPLSVKPNLLLMNNIFVSIMLLGFIQTGIAQKSMVPKLELEEITIDELQAMYAKEEISCEDVVQYYLDRIALVDEGKWGTHAVLEINPDALAIARSLDKKRQAGEETGPLFGVPVLLKDNIDTHDKMGTTAGSRALAGSHPPDDSWIAKKLRDADAIILGKANLSEWANFRGKMSTSGWSALGGQTNNPYRLDCNPCGSSSGSAVAVSANLCVLAIGTETNGSIVCPSSVNGIVGIKPTVGLISRDGIIPISRTQDTGGPMARTVRDAVICLGVLCGVDPADKKTLASKGNYYKDYTPFLKKDGLKGKRLGFFKGPMGKHHKVDTLMASSIEILKAQGAEIIEIEEISPTSVMNESFQVMLYEYKHGLNDYFTSLGPDAPIKNMEELIAFNRQDSLEMSFYGQEYLLMAAEKGSLEDTSYLNALERMQHGMRDNGIDRIMDVHDLDAIIAPTSTPAWKTDHVNGDHYILSSSTPAAIAGYPNITVPMGEIQGLPVGMSFFGTAWSEPQLIEIAFAFEQATFKRWPPQFLKP